MAIADYKEGNVNVTWTVTQTWSFDESFPKMARKLGITQGMLAKILDGEEELEFDDVIDVLTKAGELQEETHELDSVEES